MAYNYNKKHKTKGKKELSCSFYFSDSFFKQIAEVADILGISRSKFIDEALNYERSKKNGKKKIHSKKS
ncbi:MAG: hypothetical protein PUB96_08770 [Helicobacteraceae bacterium]|nr:hypothetical protein [Helicobacteraceae bacterium]